MKKTIVVISLILIVAWGAGSASAANWIKVGTSSFSTTPSLLQDANRIMFNSIVVDPAGNIFATANNGENSEYTYTDKTGEPYLPPLTPTLNQVSGGVTIFQPGGGKIDIQVSDFSDPTWSNFSWGPSVPFATYGGRTDNRFVGAIDKLVVGGDGKVYGLMHYLEINWGTPAGRQNHRIVRINPNGTVDPIHAPARPYTGNGTGSGTQQYTKGAGTTYSWTGSGITIEGITVGGDGNIYFTMNDNDGYWKVKYLWRYNVVSLTVEEAPGNTYGAVPPGWATNNGRQQDHRMFDLEWVGLDPFDATNQMFAVIFRQKTGGSWGADWRVDPMGWKTNRWQTTDPYEAAPNCLSQPGFRDWITATAYDPVNRKLVVCGRGAAGSNVFTRWADDPTRPGPGLFTQTVDPPYDYKIEQGPNSKHANGNEYSDITPNGGNYWISALTINSDLNKTWMAFTAEPGYNYEPTGTILSWDTGSMRYQDIINEGVPEADAYTVGLTFSPDGSAAYALVCSKSTGAYSVYRQGFTSSIGGIKSQVSGSLVITDAKKLVTYSELGGAYFYIQEDNHGPGIKVVPNEGVSAAYVGDRASVRGTLDVLDGEAVIYASTVTPEATLDSIPPVFTNIRNIGGAQAGIQLPVYALDSRKSPALLVPAIGANTTGQRVRVFGKVYGSVPTVGFYVEDASGYGIWVAYVDEILDNDTSVTVSGVSSTMWDTPNAVPIRVIRPNFLEVEH